MKPTFLKPISPEDFENRVSTLAEANSSNYLKYFKPYIENIDTYAIGPYYWFVPDNSTMLTIAASENMSQLTPYPNFDLADRDINNIQAFADMIIPDEREYVLSAIQFVMEKAESMTSEMLKNVKFNIYARFKNAHNIYRWVVVQFPAFYITKRVESLLVLVTDLSHLNLIGTPLLTVCDYSNKSRQYFKIMMNPLKEIAMEMPKITKREQDIVRLMAKGLTSPEIAKSLFITNSTVENHRKNLRDKTNTKTSAELMNYIIYNNLL